MKEKKESSFNELNSNMMILPFLLLFVVIALIPLSPYIINTVNGTAGVCIYKGQAYYGGLFGGSSSGIPLRGIVIKVSHPAHDDSPESFFTDGTTDRTGCFTFKTDGGIGSTYVLRYFYNGQEYADTVSTGTVLQDNLP